MDQESVAMFGNDAPGKISFWGSKKEKDLYLYDHLLFSDVEKYLDLDRLDLALQLLTGALMSGRCKS